MMKPITFLILALFISTSMFSQNHTVHGGEYIHNQDKTPCLTLSQKENIQKQIQLSIRKLEQENRLMIRNKQVNSQSFIWPIKKSDDAPYNEIWGISNYVDQNASFPNQLLDYSCGAMTYDLNSGYNHAGIDIFTWPFGWKQMEDDHSEIIAAAAGQIVLKNDGEFDSNCNFNNNQWNAIYIQHDDGSIAWYGHMKEGSLTSKVIGDLVEEGEFLGIVGSSGSSTGPHLHFEVYDADNNLVDPYAGECNELNEDSWWQEQKPYNNPNINAILTHDASPIIPVCPNTETPNISNQFDVNQEIHFAIYMRDQVAGTSINLQVIAPDNVPLYNWDFDFTDDFLASWWFWNFPLESAGEWKWQATYLGDTQIHTFNVGNPVGIDEIFEENLAVHPNPFTNDFFLKSASNIKQVTITDVSGNIVLERKSTNGPIDQISMKDASSGIYFLRLTDNNDATKTVKLIKN